jgi:hypothetical protein
MAEAAPKQPGIWAIFRGNSRDQVAGLRLAIPSIEYEEDIIK